MKTKWLALTLLLGGVLFLNVGCDLRVEDTPVPTPLAKPTLPVVTQPAVGPVQPTPATATTAAPTPDLLTRPQMTVLGQLAPGVPHGVTSDGHYFKGDPQAPVMIIEFSDFQ